MTKPKAVFEVLGERMRREPSGHTRREWLCRCACGDEAWRGAQAVKTGHSTQCKKCASTTHGYSATREYKAWYAMQHRCANPKNEHFDKYGGRGIKVCKRWHSFETFLADMGTCPSGLTLERSNNDGDYKPSNCLWATRRVQSVNRSNTVWLTAFGVTQHLSAWARAQRLNIGTLQQRLQRGWPVEKALTLNPSYANKAV